MVINNKTQINLVFPWFLYLFITVFAVKSLLEKKFVLILLLHISQFIPLSLYCLPFFLFFFPPTDAILNFSDYPPTYKVLSYFIIWHSLTKQKEHRGMTTEKLTNKVSNNI